MGACIGGCALHLLKHSSNCCICDCCYGSLKKSYCTQHDASDGGSVFNSPFALVLYDKWVKESDVYTFREKIFEEIERTYLRIFDENMARTRDLVILDCGCGTGIFTEMLSKRFMTHKGDKLICLDTSAQCLHFVRTRVVEESLDLRDKHIEYFCNESDALCLNNNYDDNDIDLILMAFVLSQISMKNGDRDSILRELYKICRVGGIFVVMEYGTDFLKQFKQESNDAKAQDNTVLLKDIQNDTVSEFKSCGAVQQYVESFGFRFERRIMESTFGNNQWIILFRKSNDQ